MLQANLEYDNYDLETSGRVPRTADRFSVRLKLAGTGSVKISGLLLASLGLGHASGDCLPLRPNHQSNNILYYNVRGACLETCCVSHAAR